jgi:hypothetical protein
MKAMEPTFAESAKQQGIALDDILGVFGSEGDPMTMSWKPMEGSKSAGRMFVPLDWDRLIRIVAAASKERPALGQGEIEMK